MRKLESSWETSISKGEYRRKSSEFRNWISKDGSTGHKAEPGRYHLYVSLACPWAHRTIIFRELKGLQSLIDVSAVHPTMGDRGWSFQHDEQSMALYGTSGDRLYQRDYLRELYLECRPDYRGNITVPVLWDKQEACIVNNESSEIIRMLNSSFDELTGNTLDFYPKALRAEIDSVNAMVYNAINNGVYKTGFATTQAAYERHCTALFEALDEIETRLADQRYLVGGQITEADW